MPKTKRAALLARVSSQSQGKADRLGIPVQLETGRLYAERMGFQVYGEYVDQISGASETREAFYRLLTEADQYEVVIVYDLYRLARNEELGHRFLRLLEEVGLEVHSSTRGIISKDIHTSIEIALSAEERRKIYQRTTSARIAIARRGELPNAMQALGYSTLKRQAIIVPHEAEIVYPIFEMSASGLGFVTIARTLQEQGVPTARAQRGERDDTRWSPQAVARIVQNPIYKGLYVWHHTGSSYEITVPAIVSEALWEAAQKKRSGPPARLNFPLSGHLFCGLCGARLSSRRMERRRRPADSLRVEEFYRCNNRAMPKFRQRCDLPQFSRRKLEPLVDKELRRIMTDPTTLRQYLKAERPPDPAKLTERAHLQREDEQWLEAFRQGAITAGELAEYRKAIKAKMRLLEAEPTGEVALPLNEYKNAAESMNLAELLEFASVDVTVRPGHLHFKLG